MDNGNLEFMVVVGILRIEMYISTRASIFPFPTVPNIRNTLLVNIGMHRYAALNIVIPNVIANSTWQSSLNLGSTIIGLESPDAHHQPDLFSSLTRRKSLADSVHDLQQELENEMALRLGPDIDIGEPTEGCGTGAEGIQH